MKIDKLALVLDLIVVFAVSAAIYKGTIAWPWAAVIFIQLTRAQIMSAHLQYLKGQLDFERTLNEKSHLVHPWGVAAANRKF